MSVLRQMYKISAGVGRRALCVTARKSQIAAFEGRETQLLTAANKTHSAVIRSSNNNNYTCICRTLHSSKSVVSLKKLIS